MSNDSRSLTVHLLPALAEPAVPVGSVAVVIDILRASTTIVHALAHGAKQVLPCLTVDDAQKLAAAQPERPLLGGERHGQLIPGFDLDNSPLKYTPEAVRDRTVVFTTTNGTKALEACRAADEVLIGAFVNRAALAARLRSEPRPIHLMCAGTDGMLTAEDILFAGSIAAELVEATDSLDLQPQMAIDFAGVHLRSPEEFRRTMFESRGGRNLVALNCEADIERAMTLDLFDLVPVWTAATGAIRATA
ncbi:MAG: 2-phosphosulfolactate phosphatase [Planctomycetaceae bacterium]|nr:2-phosphosulfolactate phosphatase [Planctomycetaceae bacterium]